MKVQKIKYSFYAVGNLLESNVDIWQFLMKSHYEKPQKSLQSFHISYFQICLYSGLMELRFLETQNHYFLSNKCLWDKKCDVNLTNLFTFQGKKSIFYYNFFNKIPGYNLLVYCQEIFQFYTINNMLCTILICEYMGSKETRSTNKKCCSCVARVHLTA